MRPTLPTLKRRSRIEKTPLIIASAGGVRVRRPWRVHVSRRSAGLGSSLRDSKVALRARLSSTEKESTQQAEMIKRLNSELAAANDRLARAQYRHQRARAGKRT